MTVESTRDPAGQPQDDVLWEQLRLDEDPGPALPIAAEVKADLARQVIVKSQPNARVFRFARPVLLGVAAVGSATAAAALGVEVSRWVSRDSSVPPAPQVAVPVKVNDKTTGPTPSPTPETEPTPTPLPQTDPGKASTSALPAQQEPNMRSDTLPLVGATAEVPSPASSAASSSPAKPPPEDRLRAANRLRTSGHYLEALTLYRAVLAESPGPLPAQVARIAAASIHLEHTNDPHTALQLYRDAARTGGPLSSEAAFGIAEAYRARGETANERKALTRFLGHHPDSPLARAARSRLRYLDQ